ncbi:hypothetical protein DFJ63DRAFT_318032 [Scheffersomyces coipomensis]|uniref:uncharacterized protein n=1 Tax=Scheffersomyces coipomensis TaxID=1788519 RepID=UPI00315D8CF9
MRLRLKSKTGIKTIVVDDHLSFKQFINDGEYFNDLKSSSSDEIVAIKRGFPPVSISLHDIADNETITDKGIKAGDQLIIEFGRGVTGGSDGDVVNSEKLPQTVSPQPSSISSIPTSDKASTAKEDDIPSVYIPDLKKYLILRNIPDDNSCLFNSISYALSGYDSYETISPPSELRKVIVQYIQNDPLLYNEVILGRPVEEYCQWILKKDSWGGAIELGILANWFNIRIDCLDIESGKFIQFKNEDSDIPIDKFIILIYSGIHYDLLALNPIKSTLSKDKADDITQFEINPTTESIILEQSCQTLCHLLQTENYATNTTTFRVRCLDCYKILVGEMGATKHANTYGHFRFGEVK